MSLQYPKVNENYVPAYQISAMPFVTSSNVALGATTEISFPTVTRFVSVKNNTATTQIAVGFTANGMLAAKSNCYFLSGSESFNVDVKTSKLFISGSSGVSANFSVLAGLTGIELSQFMTVTGSNGFGGVG